MLFQQINGFVRAQQLERSFRYFSQRTVFQKCSCPSDRQYIEFSGGSNYRSKNRNDFSRGANYRSKIRDESSSKANYHSKNRADQNNRCHENAGKFRRNIVSSEISSKSQEFRRNSFALLLHNTVDRFHVTSSLSKVQN